MQWEYSIFDMNHIITYIGTAGRWSINYKVTDNLVIGTSTVITPNMSQIEPMSDFMSSGSSYKMAQRERERVFIIGPDFESSMYSSTRNIPRLYGGLPISGLKVPSPWTTPSVNGLPPGN